MATVSSSTSGTPTSSIQGLASNIQWGDLIDSIMAANTANTLTPVTAKQTANTAASAAWSSYGTLASSLNSAVLNLSNGAAFSALTTQVGTSASTGASLLTASATSSATPGVYGVQVMSLAGAQQLSGNIVSDPTQSMNMSGQLVISGKVVSIGSGDSLNAIRDKINAVNSGDSPSHVSASVLMTGGNAARLVLTSDIGGASGVDIRDVRTTASASSLLSQLGFTDGSASNIGSDGAVRSAAYGSAGAAVGGQLDGVSALPAPTTMLVNGRSVSVDLSSQSLNDIAAAINAQSPNSASVETTVNGSTTTYRLKISGTVAASSDPASAPTLDLLGLTRGTTGIVKQQASTSNPLLASDNSVATSATALAGLKIAGGQGAQSGDTFTINGLKPDGTTVSLTETVSGSNTVNDMLTDLSNAFSSTGRHVTASIVDGKIQLTDDAGGDSAMTFSIGANNESGVGDPTNGGSLAFGATSIDVVGRQRQLQAGSDARIAVNGVVVTRGTNTISDAIPGVTLNLQQAEPGTTVDVTVAQDTGGATQALQQFVSAYNSMRSFVTSSTAQGGALAFNSSIRTSFQTIRNALLSNVPGLPAPFNNATLVGLSFDSSGTLSVDTATFNAAIAKNPSAVKTLFATTGSIGDAGFSYVTAGSSSGAGTYTAQISRAATQATATSIVSNFSYNAGSSTDTMSLTDSSSGRSGTITLATGDTPDSLAQKLNTLFASQGMKLKAATANGILSVAATNYGSAPSFTVTYASSASNDIAGLIGIGAAAVQNGLDVQGSFTGADGVTSYTATGLGQVLTATSGDATGLSIAYNGTTSPASSQLTFTRGLGGIVAALTDQLSRSGDGLVAQQTDALKTSITDLGIRATSIQSRLDAQRASLTAQFTAMETALSKLQAQGSALTSQINSLPTIATLQGSSS
jgi:flagellar hook-associated protein 2